MHPWQHFCPYYKPTTDPETKLFLSPQASSTRQATMIKRTNASESFETHDEGWNTASKKSQAAARKAQRALERKRVAPSQNPTCLKETSNSNVTPQESSSEEPPLDPIHELTDAELSFFHKQLTISGFRPTVPIIVEDLRQHLYWEYKILVVDLCWRLDSMRWHLFRASDGLVHIVTYDYDYQWCPGKVRYAVNLMRREFGPRRAGREEWG